MNIKSYSIYYEKKHLFFFFFTKSADPLLFFFSFCQDEDLIEESTAEENRSPNTENENQAYKIY
jgi:hypothetical protein